MSVGPVGRRQFVLSPRPTEVPHGFVPHELRSGWHLSTCPTLPVTRAVSTQGRDRILLGVATDTAGRDLTHDLGQLDRAGLETAYRAWSGRWVLIDDEEVHLDGTGLLSVYRREDVLASTPALLPGAGVPDRPLHLAHILNFQPGPGTGIDGVTRLVPSQVLSLRDGSIRTRALAHPQQVAEHDAPALVEEVGRLLLAAVAGAAELGPVVVPLTAGYDSRLLLAACMELGVRPRLVTQRYPALPAGDRRLAPLLAERLGLRHEFVDRGVHDPGLAVRYDQQVAGLVREADRDFFAHDQFGWVHEGDVLLRGTALDYTRGGMHSWLEGVELDAGPLARALGADPAQRDGLARWVAWARSDPQPMTLHDRFCIEQMLCSYTAVTETALDLLAPHSVMPGNSTAYQEAALSLPLSWRKTDRHHAELVARWAPAIADVPYNPPRTAREKIRRIPAALRRRARGVAAWVATQGS